MDETQKNRLQDAGIDCDAGIARVMQNEALFLKVLKKFIDDTHYRDFLACLQDGNMEQARVHIHTLKGLSANLSMERLREECLRAEGDLKAGNIPQNKERLAACYQDVKSAIEASVD